MHSIRLDIEDSVFEKVIHFLNNLPKNEVKIIENITIKDTQVKLKFNSIELKTKGFKFDREEANAR